MIYWYGRETTLIRMTSSINSFRAECVSRHILKQLLVKLCITVYHVKNNKLSLCHITFVFSSLQIPSFTSLFMYRRNQHCHTVASDRELLDFAMDSSLNYAILNFSWALKPRDGKLNAFSFSFPFFFLQKRINIRCHSPSNCLFFSFRENVVFSAAHKPAKPFTTLPWGQSTSNIKTSFHICILFCSATFKCFVKFLFFSTPSRVEAH